MLLEESARGGRVECLACKRPIQVDAPAADGPPKPPGSAGAPSTGERGEFAGCPKCNTPLRLPADHRGRPIKCPKCGQVFTV
jgi:hypothetical protein